MKSFSKYRSLFLVLTDVVLVLFSYICALEYSQKAIKNIVSLEALHSAVIMLLIYIVVLISTDTYRSLWRYAQIDEYLVCSSACALSAALYMAIERSVFDQKKPFSFYAMIGLLTVMLLNLVRIVYRLYRDKRYVGKALKRAVIIGAGAAGSSLLTYSKQLIFADFTVVAIVDDDPKKIGKKLCGVRIHGPVSDIAKICSEHKAEKIILAIPSASPEERKKIIDLCTATGCEVQGLPSLTDLNKSANLASQIRSITPEDLLGRHPVEIANENVMAFVKGKTVLVTGGGGSIGSELCRQIAGNEPAKLVIVDIYENNAYDIQQELIRVHKREINLSVHIASVRDRATMDRIFALHKPDIVIHAAAHKHVPLMEDAPKEAVKNNVFGTKNVAELALEHGVQKFLLISTDKAVNPTNIMGATKRVCEIIVCSLNGRSDTVYSSVRFGNVLGSNGSVIPLFKKEIENGGPVTVTHKDIIRYFMTIPEAAQLVLTAGAFAKGGEIFVLDMGAPVKIDDLARNLIRLSGLVPDRDIKIEYTGLRPGEKLYEELLLSGEGEQKTENNKIFIGKQESLDPARLEKLLSELEEIVSDPALEMDKTESKLMEIVPTFKRPKN